jgi:hypothetical protein
MVIDYTNFLSRRYKIEHSHSILINLLTCSFKILFVDYMRQTGSGSTGGGPRSGYDELDTTLMPPRPGEQYGRGGSGGSPANAGGGSTGSGGGAGPPGVPPHAAHHYGGGGPAGLYFQVLRNL